MNNLRYKRAVGLYRTRAEAEKVIQALKNDGYNMDRVSVIAKDNDKVAGHATTQTKDVGNEADKGAATGALAGGTLGGITGLLVGLGLLAIPGVGPILLAGAEATTIATTLAGAGIGAAAGGLVGALIGLGIPEEKAKIYSDGVSNNQFLVMVTGTEAEINKISSIMRNYNVSDFDIYDAAPPTTATTATTTTNTTMNNYNPELPKTTNIDRDVTTTDQENIKLYEERLVVDKQNQKVGEATIGKRVETETASVNVPVRKERLVIERKDVVDGTPVNPNTVDFDENKVARVEIYEETANVSKEAYVREEVGIRKEVEQGTVQANETVHREELVVETDETATRKVNPNTPNNRNLR